MNSSTHFKNESNNPRKHAAETRMLRYISDTLTLPALCRSRGCRRTGKCNGDPRDCLARFIPLVPEAAREWVRAVLEGLDENRAFEEVFADNMSEFEEFAAWQEAVARAYPPVAARRERPAKNKAPLSVKKAGPPKSHQYIRGKRLKSCREV